MVHRWLVGFAAALLAGAPAGAQPPTAVDSGWIAAMLPILRPLVATASVVAVGADTSDHRSRILAAALAAERRVPGPGAPVLEPNGGSVCLSSASIAEPTRPRGDVVWVHWSARQGEREGLLTVSFNCDRNGRPFGMGLEQRVERGADGRWHAVGRPGGWIS